MLGRTLRDPLGLESAAGEVEGLGLLSVVTTFTPVKTTVRVRARAAMTAGVFAGARGLEVSAYEIHAGSTDAVGGERPFTLTWRNGAATDEADGAMNASGTVVGTYLHGLFANEGLRRALPVHLAARKGLAPDLRLLARLLRVDPRRLSSS